MYIPPPPPLPSPPLPSPPGLYPDVVGSHFLPRLRGSLGMFLALTGERGP